MGQGSHGCGDLELTLSGPLTIDRSGSIYYVVFTQEHGANAVDGAIIGGRLQLDSA